MRGHSFNRPPRVRPRWPAEAIELPEPPAPPEPARADWVTMLMPLAGAGVFAGAAGLGGGNPLLVALPMGAMALMGLGAGLLGQRAAARRAAAAYAERRALFEDQLELGFARLRRLHEQERAARIYLSPDPAELLLIAGAAGGEAAPEPRLWERRPGDDDFLELRLGAGCLPAASQARVPPPTAGGAVDRRLHRAAAEYATLRQVPISVPLGRVGSLGIAGPRAAAASLARALVWQAVTLHAPADLRLAALFSPQAATEWEWLRWLPHCVPLSNNPAPGARMLAGGPNAVARLASELLDQLSRRREGAGRAPQAPAPTPRLLVLVDGAALPHDHPALSEILRHGGTLGMATLLIAPSWPQIPEACAAMAELDERGGRWTRAGDAWPRERFAPDRAELAASDRLARRLAGVRLLESGGAQAIPRGVRLFDLLGARGEAEFSPPRWWGAPPKAAWHPGVPIGAGADGAPVHLDLNEGRHGPHGIIAGATGAGKSVLLQTIIAALAATHGPERLQLLLIDFKGGAALMPFATLPHTAGLVTDLEGRMAERAITALRSELRRRKGLLKDAATAHAAKVENIGDYRALAARAGLPPLPNLLVVVDEFDELARGNPEFVAELVRVVKQGRSLGVCLLLATQQPARAVSDEIRSQLSYFIALRLGGAEDSREMLLKPDAAFLPTDLPGRAYLRAGGEVLLLQVATVTGPHTPAAPEGAALPRVSFLRDGREQPVAAATPRPAATPRETDLDVLVRALRAAHAARGPAFPGWSPPSIWQPPLPPRLPLADLAPWPGPAGPWAGAAAPWLRQVVGLLDLPQEGRREPFAIDLGAGHLAVVGAPGSGKTTLLRTLVLGLTAAHSPRDLWCYLVDAGGQGLSPLAGLPHVGAHLLAREGERVRRLLHMLAGMIAERQDLLRAADAADLPDYRARAGASLPAVLVVIDKVAVLREELGDGGGDEALIDELIRLARQGRPFGVHLALSADRAADLSYRLLALIETRVALRQPELHDYGDLLGARVSAQIPAALPGRALVAHPDHGALELQVALPCLGAAEVVEGEAAPPDADLARDLRERVAALAAAWGAPDGDGGPPPVELLPDLVPLASLAPAGGPPGDATLAAPIGRERVGLGPAWLRLGPETPHALVIGPRRSGKSQALLTIARALAARASPDELRVHLLDGPRGALLPLRELPHTGTYAADEPGAAAMAEELLAARAAGGARRLIVVDDYHLARERLRGQLAQSYGGQPNLFELLCEIAQVGGQLGEHLVLAAAVAYADDNLLRALDGGRSGLVLWPGRYDPGTRLLGAALPLADQRGAHQPPGRALLVGEDDQQLVQLALSGVEEDAR
ncbi:MAG TPA: FtsK/SpoIIIE domain-containing protein [Chloroflexaceae bacterium]|nr:FtsK/SpoIIIE domain-containing protein [Chloroflexaceae bacterium]